MDNDSDADTLTSSDCSDDEKYSDQTLSDHDNDSDVDNSDTESYRSLTFSVQSNRSTATIKSKKSKKRVQFKPGDSLVLVYIIPNREMLGLKSDSEDSDDSSDGGDSEDEDDDDDDDTDDDTDDEKDDSDDEDNKDSKKKNNKPKPFGRLMSIQQVTKHKKNEQNKSVYSNSKPARDKTPKMINLSLSSISQKPPKRGSRASRRRERREKAKNNKKENNVSDNKTKHGKSKRNKANAITVDFDRLKRPRRSKPGILAIKATVKGDDNNGTTASVPKVVYKHDLKPSVINVNGALNVSQTKLLQRSKLQPVSLKVSKGNTRPNSSSGTSAERQTNVRQVVSTSYDSLTSLLPDSYNVYRHSIAKLQDLEADEQNDKDIFKRLDPGNMTDRSKRHYAWQVANGNISSQSLRTPSILPFWDSLKDTVPGTNGVKYPT